MAVEAIMSSGFSFGVIVIVVPKMCRQSLWAGPETMVAGDVEEIFRLVPGKCEEEGSMVAPELLSKAFSARCKGKTPQGSRLDGLRHSQSCFLVLGVC